MDQFIVNIKTIIALQGFVFVAFLLLDNRIERLANFILCLLVTALALHMALNLAGYFGAACAALSFLYGPLLLAYTKSLLDPAFQVTRGHLVHAFLPVCAVLSIFFLPIPAVYYAIPISISLGGYGIAALRAVRARKANLDGRLSEQEEVTLGWLSYLISFKLLLLLVNGTSIAISQMGMEALGPLGRAAIFLWLLVYVNFVVFTGLRHPGLFQAADGTRAREKGAEAGGMSDAEIADILDRLDREMVRNQCYLNPNLTLKSLGRTLCVSPRLISVAVNRGRGQVFSDYVNGFRIDHAKSLLSTGAQRPATIVDVMLEAGFNSKSNFYRAFRAETGKTPSEYRQGCVHDLELVAGE